MIIKEINQEKLKDLLDYLYTAKTNNDPMTKYMNNVIDEVSLLELLNNPALFASSDIYNSFVERYFPDVAQGGSMGALLNLKLMQTIMQNKHTQMQRRQQIYQINYERLHHDANKLLNNKNIRNNLHNTAEINRIRRTTTRELTDIHEQVLDNQIRQTRNGIQRIKPESITHDNIDHEKKVQDLLDKRKQYIHNTNKRLEKNKDNRVKWMGERLKDEPAKYKVWKYTPNPKTRHACNDGQTVPLEEKFLIQNCKTGETDEMDYPGDWKAGIGNTINCLCEIEFTNEPPKDKTREETNTHAEEEKTKIWNKKSSNTKMPGVLFSMKKTSGQPIQKQNNNKKTNTIKLTQKDEEWITKHVRTDTPLTRTLKEQIKEEKEYYTKTLNYKVNDFEFNIDSDGTIVFNHILKGSIYDSDSYNHACARWNVESQITNKYTEQQQKTIDKYTGTRYHSAYNKWQRDGKTRESIVESRKENEYLQRKTVNEIEKIFQQMDEDFNEMAITLDKPMMVYTRQWGFYKTDGKKIDDIGQWDNTKSVSIFENLNEEVFGDHIIATVLPAGTRFIPILRSSQYGNEAELLIMPESQYKIDKYDDKYIGAHLIKQNNEIFE